MAIHDYHHQDREDYKRNLNSLACEISHNGNNSCDRSVDTSFNIRIHFYLDGLIINSTMYRIIVIDSSKGNAEGSEYEKLVAWYPHDMSETVRDAGLLQGLLHFASLFGEENSASDIIDFGSVLWVCGTLPIPNFYLSIMVDKQILGRHVTDMNLLGVIKNITDVLEMVVRGNQSDEEVVSSLITIYGERLNSKQSWLRKQLRNPFGMTWGATRSELPEELESSFRDSCVSLSTGLALFKDEVCLYSSLEGESTNRLGSLVLSELHTFFIVGDRSVKSTKATMGFTSLGEENRGTYYTATSQGCSLFILVRDESSFIDLQQKAFDIIQMTIDYIDSFRWSEKKQRHVPGVRYLFQNEERLVCSPRDKVSSSSHHTRAIATTLRDSGGSIHGEMSIYTCDKGSDCWGALSSNNQDLSVSVSLRGLARKHLIDEFRTSQNIHSRITQ